jgi:hypothetical protein
VTDDDPRYPVGRFVYPGVGDDARRRAAIQSIADTPARLRAAVAGLSREQMETPYRDGGWTVRQVAHHVPESHMNAYIRFKLALTEDSPTIKPYHEDRWAMTGDVPVTPVETSLALLDALHARWVDLLHTLRGADWERTYVHPEYGKTFTLDQVLALYEWHGRHHVAHVTSLRERKGW